MKILLVTILTWFVSEPQIHIPLSASNPVGFYYISKGEGWHNSEEKVYNEKTGKMETHYAETIPGSPVYWFYDIKKNGKVVFEVIGEQFGMYSKQEGTWKYGENILTISLKPNNENYPISTIMFTTKNKFQSITQKDNNQQYQRTEKKAWRNYINKSKRDFYE